MSEEYTYKNVRAVYTSWDEVYIYGDGELVDTVDFSGMDENYAQSMVEEYTLDSKNTIEYELSEEYEEDSLPDYFREISKKFLDERENDTESMSVARCWGW